MYRPARARRPIPRTIGRWAARLLLSLPILAAIQAIVLYGFAARSYQPEAAELAVLFKGDEGRVSFFYDLVKAAAIKQTHIPGVSQERLAAWDKAFNTIQIVHLQGMRTTSSTFEDALSAAMTIRTHGIRSVLLVTSDYHIPRSWFLLRTLTLGSNVAIHPVQVPSRMRTASVTVRGKMIYNELINFWGSMIELAYHHATGRLFFENRRAMVLITFLKKKLLFDVF